MTTDQIAVEAWSEMRIAMLPETKAKVISIIKSAIEKAVEPLKERCLDFDSEYEKGYTAGWEACDREREVSAAQAGDKK